MLKRYKAIEIIPGYRAQFVQAEGSTLAFRTVAAGAAMLPHQHVHEPIA